MTTDTEPPVREATETQDFEQVTILPQATVGITEPAPNERITTEVIPEPDLVLSKQGFESNAPAILTTTNSITEPAPAPVPAIAKVKPVSLEKKTQVGPDIHKAKQKPQRKIRAKKTKKKKKRTARPTRKKRRVANNAPSPGRGKKSKGQARKGKTQGVRYTGAGLSNPRPRYPPAAKRKRVQGRVLLAVVVASSGRANSVRIRKSSGHRLLDQAAVKTVKRWRFKPATRNGQPVRARVIVPITFKLKG